ncbi:hypothetical protein MTR67_016923 [Solanum verrucosum]|uniref:NB-ARC domain-containing protein n=1 Tax=Solanum verrucosum TaxID=315347 RepID=A0AAF0QJD6_SOLVR|nr:hypothetical protein MTR67_016923 [Solanum verrucosum]
MDRTLESWNDVVRTLSKVISSHPDKCLAVLSLSYHHLPNQLKAYFLSMSSFPEDFQVETQRLIYLWIAEGFIRSSENGKSLEEVAMDYLEDLISRNLIMVRKRRLNGEIKTCGIHDILREFCLIEAEMTKHMHVERTYPTLPTQKHNVRRFSFQTKSYSVEDFYKLLIPVARSIYLFSLLNLPLDPRINIFWRIPSYHCDPNIIPEFFSRFNLLRVLNIPESISELQNLQTLICSGYSLESISLPVKIWTMQNLSNTTEDSAREIEQEQEDMGNNILKVYIHNNRTYSAVISLLQTLDQRNIQELFHDHTAKTLDPLHATAQYFQHVLENISKSSRFDHEKIKSLEEKIRVAVSYAEDAVEMKISQIITSLSWTFGILQHHDLLPVVEKMDTTKKQVMEILSHDADQLLELSGNSLIDTSSTSYPMLEDDIVHGLDDDLEIIINRLTGRSRDLEIVTISGMGGIGKTTLARKAYDHLAIRYHHFDILAWVTISQEFRVRNVLLEALRCISKQAIRVNAKDYDKMDDSELADLVQKNLKHRRYLVVVDDIWSTGVWDSIRGIFPDCNNKSRILLTTRETEVAIYANTSIPHKMNLLSLANGWKLLCDKVFGPKHDYPPELEEIGKEIVGKCQGLPLTILVIAGHLSKMTRTLEGWKDVAQNLSEIIASHPDKCLGVLGLSYHHLPNRLKPCFLSMSGFPEDFQIESCILIQLWIAEGFIRMSAGNCRSLEEVAIDYLEDLISRNLIQKLK